MKLQVVEPSLEALDGLEGVEAFCLLVASDERPLAGAAGYLDWRLLGGLSRLLAQGFFKGDVDEKLLLPSQGRVPPLKVFAVGVGPSGKLDVPGLDAALVAAAGVLKKAQVASVALALPEAPGLPDLARAEAVRVRFAPAFGGEVVLLADKSVRHALEK